MIDELFAGSPWLLLLTQGTTCLVVGLAASYVLRHRPARAHQVLLTALLASVLMPGLYLSAGHFGLGVLVPRTAPPGSTPALASDSFPAGGGWATSAPVSSDLLTAEIVDESLLPVAEPVGATAAQPAAIVRVRWSRIAFGCWTVATVTLLLRLILRFLLGLHVVYAAHPLDSEPSHQAIEGAKSRLGIRASIRARCSQSVRSPVIWCWSRAPVLILHEDPSQAQSDKDWTGIFCHEMSHWKRLDHITGLFAEIVTAVFPWHPLLWRTKSRLLRLSEQVCDDWVLATGQRGVDYAESLLDLAPARQAAFVPTIIEKEKAMKKRICRIVKDRCGNPRIGLQWAMGVSALAVLASVGVALAQQRPAPREPREGELRLEVRQEQAAQRVAVAGRRNVLIRLREQLQGQARDTEAALRQRGDEAPEEDRVLLHAELETLQEQIELVERQLRDLEPGSRRPGQAEPRPSEHEARLNELRRHQEELAENARAVERELGGLRDGQDQEARELRAHLERLHAQMGEVERQLAELSRAQEAGRIVRARPAQPQPQPENMRQRRAELAEETRRIEQRLRELRPDQNQEARELRARLQVIHDQMAEFDRRSEEIRRALPQVERTRALVEARPRTVPAESRRLEAEVDELRNQMREMREQMQEMQKLLEQVAARGQTREGAGEQR